MKKAILQAIKSFDIQALNLLLDDDRPYMEVSKALFLKILKKEFDLARKDDCYGFDDIFFGICGSCNKGCEGMTFLAHSGHYLDLYIEETKEVVEDIYVCNNLMNFTDLDKKYNMGFIFYKDEEVKFIPTWEYTFIEEQYNLLLEDSKSLINIISLEDLELWYAQYSALKNSLDAIDMFEAQDFKLYSKASDLIGEFEHILNIKARADHAVEALVSYQMATGERERLIWFFNNRMDQHALVGFVLPGNPILQETIIYKSDALQLLLNITGYEYVVDYFNKVKAFNRR